MPITITNGQWRTAFGVIAAVASFALATDLHPDVVLPPVVQFALGALLVGLAALKVPEEGTQVG